MVTSKYFISLSKKKITHIMYTFSYKILKNYLTLIQIIIGLQRVGNV